MIGMMDWGIGGLGVYRALRARGAAMPVVYLSDTGSTPYGRMTRGGLRQRFREIATFFKTQRVTSVLVACHAASSALKRDEENVQGVLFRSIAPFTHQAAASARGRTVGVIGGNLTIASGLYQRRLSDLLDKTFIFQSAQALSAMVEAGQSPTGEPVIHAVAQVLDDLGPVDGVLLACTHYPALRPAFAELAPDLEILDPSELMVASVDGLGSGELFFYSTGPVSEGITAAESAYGVKLRSTTQLDFSLRQRQ